MRCLLGGRPTWRLERVRLACQDLTRLGARMPLGRKHAVWISTGTPACEAHRSIAVYEVELEKKKVLEKGSTFAAGQVWRKLPQCRYHCVANWMELVCKP
jgi:hypothetical protein